MVSAHARGQEQADGVARRSTWWDAVMLVLVLGSSACKGAQELLCTLPRAAVRVMGRIAEGQPRQLRHAARCSCCALRMQTGPRQRHTISRHPKAPYQAQAWLRSWCAPIALDPPPTQAMSTSGKPPNFSWHCCRVSLPMTDWKSRTCHPW